MEVVNQLWLLKQIYNKGNGSYYDKTQGTHLRPIPKSIKEIDLTALTPCGHPPNNIVYINHDAIIHELKSKALGWSIEKAADAFIAALWSASFLWQSALTGKLIAEAMPEHSLVPYTSESNTCKVCGLENGKAKDVTLEWYFRMVSGTPLDGDPAGHVFAFREMEKAVSIPTANEYDRWTFRAILTVLRNLPPKTRYSKATEALKNENLLPTKDKRIYLSLLDTLALIGVLATEEYPGMATAFTTYHQRDERPHTHVEVQAPLAWWNSSVGLNEAVLKAVFSNFDYSDVSLLSRPDPVPNRKLTVTGALACKQLPRERVKTPLTAGKGSAQAGDVYAIRIREGAWVTVYCHEVSAGKVRIEFMDGVFKEMPKSEELILRFRSRKDGRWQSNVSSIDATSWVRRITRNMPSPTHEWSEPERIPFSGAKDLKYLAGWCFDEL